MSNFLYILKKVIEIEGGYTLHEIPGDRGGMTYAGIARNAWPDWKGWIKVDRGEFDSNLNTKVHLFYKKNFWDTMRGDDIKSPVIAFLVFSFGVNAGRTVAKRLAQTLLGVAVDGVFGPKTIAAINTQIVDQKDEALFEMKYTFMKIQRWKNIAYRDPRRKDDIVNSNLKFLIGWINRAEKELSFPI